MKEQRSSPRFDVALKVNFEFKDERSLEGKLENLSPSGQWIMVSSREAAKIGDGVKLGIPIPVQIHTIQCEGEIAGCREHNGNYEIEIYIKDMDEQARKDIQEFCNFLIPSAKLDTVAYLIQQGEEAIQDASKASVKGATSAEMEAVINELLSLKYHDALRSFEDALKLDKENETAMEGFCYSLANAIVHYERAGLTGLAETIKTMAMQYSTKKAPEIAKNSPRISRYLMEAIKDVLDAAS